MGLFVSAGVFVRIVKLLSLSEFSRGLSSLTLSDISSGSVDSLSIGCSFSNAVLNFGIAPVGFSPLCC